MKAAGVVDTEGGRDYKRKLTVGGQERVGYDSNAIERKAIINAIVEEFPGVQRDLAREILENSPISDITEYGRVVHAEMDALLACARSGVSPKGGTLYSTTFPCHNCAKHIIAAGIHRVVYIEPYPKSKALQFHDESIHPGFQKHAEKVHFEPFVGVGPRRFFDLFSLRHGSGRDVKRKDADGFAIEWDDKSAELKLPLSPLSYLDLEELARDQIKDHEINQED
ncbi:MAG: deaminase [Candidatus Paceibacterota bacterium]